MRTEPDPSDPPAGTGRGSEGLLDDLKLRDLAAIVRMQWRLIAAALAVALVLSVAYNLMATRIYGSTASIHLSTIAGQELKVEKVVDKDLYNRLDRKIFTQTQIEILESRTLRELVVDRYHALGYDDLEGPGGGAAALFARMSVASRRNSEIIDVTVRHADPERATVLANLVAENYKEANLQAVRDSALDARHWLDTQLEEYEEAIRASTRAKLEYQASENMADADQSDTTLSDQLASLNSAFGDVNTERVQLAASLRNHESLLKRGEYPALAKELATPLMARLNEKYGAAVTESAAVTARYGERHPERQRVEAEVAAITAELQAEVKRQVEAERAALAGAEQREEGLRVEIVRAKEQLLDWHKRHEEYQKLAMELDRNKMLYEKLSNRKHELDFVASTQLNNVRIVDAAVRDDNPVQPQVLRNVAVSLFGALVVGVLIGIAREWVDDTFATPMDVRTWLRVPTLGVVPVLEAGLPEEAALHTFRNPTGPAAEAMRGVRTVLEMNPEGEALGRFAVSSAVASEGKTSLSAWLGVAFAQLGRKVVLVDCDLRRPRMHALFSLPREGGVTDFLTGEQDTVTAHPSGVTGLHVVTAGPRAPRAVELLGSSRMEELLALLERDHDLVIIDTPPAGIVSDASILSRRVDGVVFVIRAHSVRRAASRGALDSLAQVNARILGAVVNAVDPRRSRARDYYNYEYGYSHNYGRYDDESDVAPLVGGSG